MSKERLVELIGNAPIGVNGITLLDKHEPKVIEELADLVLADGWIRLPCKVGDVVYYITGINHSLVKSAIVEEIIINDCGVCDLFVTSENGVAFENSIEIFYFTREEAEAKLKESESE